MKYSISSLTLIFFCIYNNIFSQAPDIEWSLCIGGSSWDEAYTVVQSPDSGYVVGGYRSTADGDWSDCGVDFKLLTLIKLSYDGNIIWKKCYGDSENGEAIYSIINSTSGGYIFVANSRLNDGDVSGNHGSSDYWVVKIDEEGVIEWQKCYGGTGTEYPYEIIQTADGGYAVIGFSTSDDGDVTGHHPGGFDGTDYWLIKISAEGELEWGKCLGGSDDDEGRAVIAQTTDGGYVCAGYSSSDDGDVSGSTEGSDYWIVKLDAEGSILWDKNFGGSDGDYAHSATVDADGAIIIAGYTDSEDGDIIDSYGGSQDTWVVKIDSAGNIIRTKCYGGFGGEKNQSIAMANENDYIFCGYTNSSDGDLTAESIEGIWVFKTDSAGVIKWQKTLGGSDNQDGFDAIPTYDGGTAVVGYTASTDGDVTGNHGGRDAWVVKLSPGCPHEKYYTDADADGYGNSTTYIYSCTDTAGYVTNSLDCNDADSLVYPAAEDICNAIDDNCNGFIDEDATFTMYFADADGDGYGDETNDSLACSLLTGFVTDSTDCNDADFYIHPDTKETCNFLDDNCDGNIDEGITYFLLYADADGDNFGDAENDSLLCYLTEGFVPDSSDCDDTNPAIYPGAPEILNGTDDNCDGKTDEGVSVQEAQQNDFSIYPNPTDGNIILTSSLTSYKNTIAEITDITGKILLQAEIISSQQTIHTANLVSGSYIISIKQNDVLIFREVVVKE